MEREDIDDTTRDDDMTCFDSTQVPSLFFEVK